MLPDAKTLESAITYRKRIIPVISSFIEKARNILVHNVSLKSKIKKLTSEIEKKDNKIGSLERYSDKLKDENVTLRTSAEKFNKLVSHFGLERVNSWLSETIPERQITKQRHHDYER